MEASIMKQEYLVAFFRKLNSVQDYDISDQSGAERLQDNAVHLRDDYALKSQEPYPIWTPSNVASATLHWRIWTIDDAPLYIISLLKPKFKRQRWLIMLCKQRFRYAMWAIANEH